MALAGAEHHGYRPQRFLSCAGEVGGRIHRVEASVSGRVVERMRIGAHESIAGGVSRAFERAAGHGAEALQIFTKSGRQWAAKPLDEAEVAAFHAARR